MSDDVSARAREVAYRHYLCGFEADKAASDYPERMKPDTAEELFEWPEYQALVDDIAAALHAYGDERERATWIQAADNVEFMLESGESPRNIVQAIRSRARPG